MRVDYIDNKALVTGFGCFNLSSSCSCRQSFRWKQRDGGWFGIAGHRAAFVSLNCKTLSIEPCLEGDADWWTKYFDLERDYSAIEKEILNDEILSVCLPYASGIHVFNQEPFEALISFIISSNNNIGRISGIIDRLCRLAGQQLSINGELYFAFPEPCSIAKLSVEQLHSIGAGYRAPFIKKSALMVADGYDLGGLRNMSLDEARKELYKFPGVGPKVADCVLLFSLGHTDAFPIDVWMDRAMKELYFNSLPPSKAQLREMIARLGKYSGIIQQYIFHYARHVKLGK